MAETLGGRIKGSIDFVKGHPQIFLTVFIGIIIIAGFLFTSQLFLKIANETQDRFENNRLGSLQDAFVEIAKQNLGDSEYLSGVISRLAAQNKTITQFRVIRKDPGQYTIISSLDLTEINKPDNENAEIYRTFSDPTQSFSFQFNTASGRIFKVVRAIPDDEGNVRGWIETTTSLSQFDALTKENIFKANLILLGVILLIIILFVRHARIIDYATLYSRLKEVDQMKDDFVSMASHELRSPLTVIRGYTDLVKSSEGLEEVREEARTKLKNILNQIDTSARQLDSLVADILDVSRLNQGRLQVTMKEVNIAELAKTVTESFKMPAEQKGLTISFEGPQSAIISADPDRLRQVMINLIGNAVKYTPKGSVSVEVKENGGNTALRVSDTGMGITAEEQKKLFQKFYRIKSEETREITGTGLGLWITAEIIKRMNGTITVESIKGVGSHFIVVFPKKAA